MTGHSRVQSSTMVNMRITFPVLAQSLTNPSTSAHSACSLLDWSPRHSSGSAAAAESSSPILPHGTAGTPLVIRRHPFAQQHCRQSPIAKPHAPGRQFFQAASQCAVPLPLSAPDSDASIVPIPAACRRVARSSGTPPRHSSRRPEVPQALPVFGEHVFQRPVIQR